MKRYIFCLLFILLASISIVAQNNATVQSTKEERNLISQGNKLYHEGNYAQAEVLYRKALEVHPASETARFNLGSTLLRQGRAAEGEDAKKLSSDAVEIMKGTAENAKQLSLREKAFYNLGNIQFGESKYEEAIDMYKKALRINPDNDKARDNLRLAQKKLQEQQQNQNQNNDQNKDKDKDKNDQNKDQDKNDKDNNQDKDNKDNQEQKPPTPQPQQGGISDENAEKILKAMENEEKATQQRINAKRQQGTPTRRTVGNPW